MKPTPAQMEAARRWLNRGGGAWPERDVKSLATLIAEREAAAARRMQERCAEWARDHIGLATLNVTPGFAYDSIRALEPEGR